MVGESVLFVYASYGPNCGDNMEGLEASMYVVIRTGHARGLETAVDADQAAYAAPRFVDYMKDILSSRDPRSSQLYPHSRLPLQ
jgi:hypothetical protein